MLHYRTVFIILLAIPATAYAYIDPNVGGWLYQLLFPLLIAIAGAWALLRQKIKAFFSTFIINKKEKE